MRVIRNGRTRGLISDKIHLLTFVGVPQDGSIPRGLVLKLPRRDGTWRFWTITTRRSSDSRVLQISLETHLATASTNGRIPLTKRYIRFKIRT